MTARRASGVLLTNVRSRVERPHPWRDVRPHRTRTEFAIWHRPDAEPLLWRVLHGRRLCVLLRNHPLPPQSAARTGGERPGVLRRQLVDLSLSSAAAHPAGAQPGRPRRRRGVVHLRPALRFPGFRASVLGRQCARLLLLVFPRSIFSARACPRTGCWRSPAQ